MTRRVLVSLALGAAAFWAVVWLPGWIGPGPAGPRGDVSVALSQGGLVAYALIFAGGVLTSLTPCVYPLIPITVSIFGAQRARSRLAGFGLSAAYVSGMVVMYASVGVGAALTGRAFGQLLGNPWVVSGIALLLGALALSMFGLFELRLPTGLHTRLAGIRGAGPVAAFFMGLVAGILAAPCTGPVLSGVLAVVATTRDAVLGFAMLGTYALGIGVLFLLIGTFSISLPKSGAWMETVKAVFGVALLAAALWFLKPVFNQLELRPLPPALGGALVAAGMVLLALLRDVASPRLYGLAKGSGIALALAGLGVVFGARHEGPKNFPWVFDPQAAIQQAREEKRPLMVDFWADWCVACKELDKYTYVDPEVQKEAARFVTLKVDLTEPTETLDALQKEFAVQALPTVVFMDSRGAILDEPRITGFVRAPEMLAAMRKVQ